MQNYHQIPSVKAPWSTTPRPNVHPPHHSQRHQQQSRIGRTERKTAVSVHPLLPPSQTNVTPVLKSIPSASAELLMPGSFAASYLNFYFTGKLFSPRLIKLILPSFYSQLQPFSFLPAPNIHSWQLHIGHSPD